MKDKDPISDHAAWTILRIAQDVIPWQELSPEEQAVALQAVKTYASTTLNAAKAEADRLNALNGDERTIYVPVRTRMK